MAKSKRRMTQQQEFDIMKMIFDKFLWLGFIMIVFGIYNIMMDAVKNGIAWMIIGIIMLGVFLVIIVKEFEIIKH
ncbi:MAG: hypothetical protein KAS15_02605 [Nanoarchaeota archaeon]|nr:hypothetical protein [Nanoarchaeota archaeon]MCK5630535.1 hypothetical protein [Nanoarchaeota archaeon]